MGDQVEAAAVRQAEIEQQHVGLLVDERDAFGERATGAAQREAGHLRDHLPECLPQHGVVLDDRDPHHSSGTLAAQRPRSSPANAGLCLASPLPSVGPMRTTRTTLRKSLLLLAVCSLAALALASGALAGSTGASRASASAPDLVTTIAQPSGVSVYQSGHWLVTVGNRTSRNANGVVLTIQLPRTANSPTQYVLGTLGALSSGCARSGLAIVCQIGTVTRNNPVTVWFDITLPYSTNPIVFSADAPVTNDQNPADNRASATAALATYAVSFAAPRTFLKTSCTGTGTLSSFIECVPGSTQNFTGQLLAGTTSTSGPVTTPGGGGTWTLAGTQLTLAFTDDLGALAATFVGQGVGASCWEGKTTFPSTTQYVAIYRVCLQ